MLGTQVRVFCAAAVIFSKIFKSQKIFNI
jgi:hypothetical protein